jgi:hypothetical protein
MRSISTYGEMIKGLPPWPGPAMDGWNRVVSWVDGCVHRKVGLSIELVKRLFRTF